MNQAEEQPYEDRAESLAARVTRLEAELTTVRERNNRVIAEEAWEICGTRSAIIAVFTYLVAAALLWSLGDSSYPFNALVPTVGYLLSTLFVSFVRRRWIARLAERSFGDIR